MNINQWLKDHPVDCGYGAPLGDSGEKGDTNYHYKFYLQRIHMVDGGYDASGTYWGSGDKPLYGFMGEDDHKIVRGFVRARSHDDAKLEVRMQYPRARFYR